jgi:hypothetical protein
VISTIFQLYLGGQFYLWKKLEYPEKTIDLPRVAVKLTTQQPKDGEHKQGMNALISNLNIDLYIFQFHIPTADTRYQCTIHKMPSLTKKHHMIRVRI